MTEVRLKVVVVKQVHWLRARAQKNRWHEELTLVTYEMQWTVRSFLHKSKLWEQAQNAVDTSSGSRAYAHRQETLWRRFALGADKLFKNTTIVYETPIH